MLHVSRWRPSRMVSKSVLASKVALPAFALAAMLALPATVEAKTITAVMHSDLRVIDPGLTTAYITRDHGTADFR